MRKIISLFKRNYETDWLVRDEVVEGAEWVLAGEGTPTRKFDGTCCMVRGGKLYKRYDVRKGRTAPPLFEPAQEPDATTGHWPGWIPVGEGPDDKWHREAFTGCQLDDGTYELVGPKVQGNPENLSVHLLVKHGRDRLPDCPRTFHEIRNFLVNYQLPNGAGVEGIVWHHPDGRMVKIKTRDFGLEPRRGEHLDAPITEGGQI